MNSERERERERERESQARSLVTCCVYMWVMCVCFGTLCVLCALHFASSVQLFVVLCSDVCVYIYIFMCVLLYYTKNTHTFSLCLYQFFFTLNTITYPNIYQTERDQSIYSTAPVLHHHYNYTYIWSVWSSLIHIQAPYINNIILICCVIIITMVFWN